VTCTGVERFSRKKNQSASGSTWEYATCATPTSRRCWWRSLLQNREVVGPQSRDLPSSTSAHKLLEARVCASLEKKQISPLNNQYLQFASVFSVCLYRRSACVLNSAWSRTTTTRSENFSPGISWMEVFALDNMFFRFRNAFEQQVAVAKNNRIMAKNSLRELCMIAVIAHREIFTGITSPSSAHLLENLRELFLISWCVPGRNVCMHSFSRQPWAWKAIWWKKLRVPWNATALPLKARLHLTCCAPSSADCSTATSPPSSSSCKEYTIQKLQRSLYWETDGWGWQQMSRSEALWGIFNNWCGRISRPLALLRWWRRNVPNVQMVWTIVLPSSAPTCQPAGCAAQALQLRRPSSCAVFNPHQKSCVSRFSCSHFIKVWISHTIFFVLLSFKRNKYVNEFPALKLELCLFQYTACW
jgi:hypothetical protein